MFDLEEAKKQNSEQINRINDIGNSLNISRLKEELSNLESQTEDQNFWQNSENSSKVLSKISELKKKIEQFTNVINDINTITEMLELIQTENDEELEKEILKFKNHFH